MNMIAETIKNSRKVAIISHVRPDGDTLGSGLALRLALLKLSKDANVYCEDVPPEKYSYLTGFETISNGEINDVDLIIAVDCGDDTRVGKYYNTFKYTENTINIDHHASNTKYAKLNKVDGNASATAVMILKLIEQLEVEIDKDMAKCLYTGISTDTGNFCHGNTNEDTFLAACKLIKTGLNVAEITTALYKSSPKSRTMLLANTISRMRFYYEDKLAIMSISLEDFEKYGASLADTEGFIDNAIGIKGVEVAACIVENKPRSYKISFRAKKVNVCNIANMFGGGGHILAAGCAMCGFLEDVVDKVVRYSGIEMEC